MRRVLQVVFAVALLMTFSLVSATEINNEGYVEAEGFGPLKGQTAGASPIAAARRVAIMDAYRNLAESVGGIHITSDTTVDDFVLANDELKGTVDTIVHGAKVVSVTRTNEYGEDGFKAIVRLSIYGGSNSLAATVLKDVQIMDFPQPKVVNIVSGSNYTGLIIDCRGRTLTTAISPSIKSEDGREVYAYKNVGYDTTKSNGMVGYSTSIDSGVERAGSNPLKVTVRRLSGECDVVISNEDADKILAANQQSHFLNNCAVVLVR